MFYYNIIKNNEIIWTSSSYFKDTIEMHDIMRRMIKEMEADCCNIMYDSCLYCIINTFDMLYLNKYFIHKNNNEYKIVLCNVFEEKNDRYTIEYQGVNAVHYMSIKNKLFDSYNEAKASIEQLNLLNEDVSKRIKNLKDLRSKLEKDLFYS